MARSWLKFRQISRNCAVVAADISLRKSRRLSSSMLPSASSCSRLDGEIGLAVRHDFFAGIGVLNDEVAGDGGKERNHYGSLRTTPGGRPFC